MVESPVGFLDVISVFGFLMAAVVFALQTVGFGFGLKPIGLIGVGLIVLGFVIWGVAVIMSMALTGRQPVLFDPSLSTQEVFLIISTSFISLLAIWSVNIAARYFFPFSSGEIPSSSDALNMAAAEEIFFRLGLQSILGVLATSGGGILINAFFGVAFHYYRYGSNPVFLSIVFFAWIALGSAFTYSRGRLSTTLIPHLTVNFFASPPRGFEGVLLG